MNSLQESSFKCLLPDGRNVNLMTEAGADAFIGDGRGFKGFSSNIESVNTIRQKKRISKQDKDQIEMIYYMIGAIPDYASHEVFSKIPKAEIECWYDHAIVMLTGLAADPQWTQTAKLESHDFYVIDTCISLSKHPSAINVAFDKDFYKVLASFIGGRKAPLLPTSEIAGSLISIVANTRGAYDVDRNIQNCRDSEKFWKKIESTGLLLQFIRCSTIPQPDEEHGPLFLCYDELIQCLTLLSKKFKKGEPCGDGVRAILSGADGSKRKRERVMTYIRNLAKMMDVVQSRNHNSDTVMNLKMCRNCNKSSNSVQFQKDLMICSRCKQAYYCSKECQKQDWKAHKPHCFKSEKKIEKHLEVRENSLFTFAEQNYFDIMDEIIDVIDETKLKKEELLMEVDFKPDKSGSVPALRTPVEFKIKDARGYFQGTRPNEPDWYYKNEDSEMYKSNTTRMVAGLKDHYGRMTPDHILCLVRNPGGVSVNRLTLQSPKMGSQMFANATVDAYRKALKEGDFGPITLIFGEEELQRIKPIITYRAARATRAAPDRAMSTMSRDSELPSEDEMDRVRMMLNAMGGDFKLRGSGRK